jgi:tetratricopeptide (TPR) repeat protein
MPTRQKGMVEMGLFDFLKKSNSNTFSQSPASKNVVWRNAQGVITCPGDACPKGCDDSCPIYLNTQAVMLMQIGQGPKAIPIYEKALVIAPDFYDAWNNLGGIYGQMGNYSKAYECYKKARELNKVKPNPVFGLMLTSRDLGKYEACIYWCDIYKTLSRDGREIAIRDEANRKLGNKPQSDNTVKY